MSLQVDQLTKEYGIQKAVDHISFEARSGRILGFLGPNGAGKSTTMKIATGYIPPTSGTVLVGGYDVVSQAREVKRIVGYLPEHNPLYLNMYVEEYLEFMASLHGLSGKQGRRRTQEMIDLCGLQLERNKKIGALSKGYRQRVGLAQALIHDPGVLILDEPTTGLDPNQIIEIREVIREISREKTMIFSTHILQEVQALCDQVVIINRGKIVANDSVENLMRSSERVELQAEFAAEINVERLAANEGIISIDLLDDYKYRIVSDGAIDIRETVFKFAASQDVVLLGMQQLEGSLEDVFRDLTKR